MNRFQSNRSLAVGAFAAALLALPLLVSGVLAVNPTISVNSTADAIDANPGNGVCETAPGNGVCTLRAAVMEANATPGNDAIELGADTYSLSIPVTGVEPNAAFGDLNVTDTVTVFGQGVASTIVEGSATSWQDAAGRIFSADGAALGFNLFDMTIRRGHEGFGGAVQVEAGQIVLMERVRFTDNHADGLASGAGGAIYNWGAALTLVDVRFTSNYALHAGGALATTGVTTITDSIFRNNDTAGHGGAMWISGTSNSSISRSEISGNTAHNASAGGIHIGAGSVSDNANVTVTNTTFSSNGGNSSVMVTHVNNQAILKNVTINGGAWSVTGPSISLENSILANPDQNHCGGWTPTSLGHNLFQVGDCPKVASDIVADPKLGVLADNGGTSLTHALLSGSPAVDGGAGCPAVDQRGIARPIDGDKDGLARCDIGAFEAPAGTSDGPAPVPTSGPTSAPTAAPTGAPTSAPTSAPTAAPTSAPTAAPTSAPTAAPTSAPTSAPTAGPTSAPSQGPVVTPVPPTETDKPGGKPSDAPGGQPSDKPGRPSDGPGQPSDGPLEGPSDDPSPSDDAGDTAGGDPSDEPGDDTEGSDDSDGDSDQESGDDSDTPELTMPPTDGLDAPDGRTRGGTWPVIVAILAAAAGTLVFDKRVTRRTPIA